MNNTITANELKTKGVTIIDEVTSRNNEAIITVRGKNKYVVLSIEEYSQLREYELEAAIKESEEDIKNGRIYDESIDDHMKRITSV
ncbi:MULTISPECIES: type II toxin-antitoxin system Phd/YefM family antitoxin [Sediminispirochaeta]|jgi:prevent-host-death family protein|uniref:Prevent-host-death family protein n=1 Tax=Sediminispirochaeta smaragdinae (strain DSM 11293 / JCM 15392 / SEBR 4228) TaxID=573413 RepID=E1R2D2_SEDSS|nr:MULTISPECIES: type II toxin-antitoxin system prevent-host-death family antitoxin [Sediminispirochaeta]ADK82492.1 prevent-host-death family protein [Sediminispirochaeta smaragdinae DSM 11293]